MGRAKSPPPPQAADTNWIANPNPVMPMYSGGAPTMASPYDIGAMPSQNIFQQAQQGITGAGLATAMNLGYDPQQIQAAQAASQGYAAPIIAGVGPITAQNISAAQAGSQGYAAPTIAGVSPVTAQQVQAGQLAGANLAPYMNPFISDVIGQTTADLERQRQMQQASLGAQATAAGAFGGSRQGVEAALTNEAFARQLAQTSAGLRQAGFQQAQSAAQQDIAGAMQAQLANQAAGLQAQTTTGQFGLQAQLANQAALQQAGQFGASAANQAALANQQAAMQTRLANQAAGLQAQTTTGQFGLQQQLANQAAQQQAGQFGASAANQAALANQQAAMQAALANQAAGLSGAQFRLGAAGQLADISNLGFGMGQQVQQGLFQQGATQQMLQQAIIDAARQQYAGYTGAPAQSLGYMAQALGATPVPQTQTTTRQPGLFDYLTLAATAASGTNFAGISDIRLKTNIERIGELPNGLSLYRWSWNDIAKKLGINTQTIGVMAHEAREVMPEAVTEGEDGYLRVNYGMILGV